MNRSQSATEFMMLIAAVLLIFLPLFYIFTSYGFKSDTEINAGKINELARKIVYESREIYFLGLWSKEVITFSIPEGIDAMDTLIINPNDPSEEYYFLVSYQKGEERIELAIPSEIPLLSQDCDATCPTGAGSSCITCHLDEVSYVSGTRDFKLEAIESPLLGGRLAVNITRTQI